MAFPTNLRSSCPLIVGLLVSVVVGCWTQAAYPANGGERQFVEQIFEKILTNMNSKQTTRDQLIANIQLKLKEQLDIQEEKVSMSALRIESDRLREIKLANLIEQYLRLSYVNEANCGETIPNDLLYLLKFHSDSPQSKVYEYLHELARWQFSICDQLWNGQLLDIINNKLGETIQEKMSWLVETLVAVSTKSNEPFSSPYSKQQLGRICLRPPIAGLVLYMSRFNGLLPDLDENLKNPNIDRNQIQVAAKKSIAPLCRPVCAHLSPISEQFQLLFRYRVLEDEYQKFQVELKQKRLANDCSLGSLLRGAISSPKASASRQMNKPDSNDYLAAQWLTGKIVCCKLIANLDKGQLLDQIHREVTVEPESYFEANNTQELEFSELIAQMVTES